ncbi:4'-phosphopantetheinyl transferase superfamily protein [Paenibacillus qinlingensis]|uniref:4'-phosphopantetheinyl transferase family protein n=1 Tax=Paenibacillus qinlingensis TaxID=1837343 RepID=UPI00236791FE|nr:4'-phosphopantetheinyl transferase superfamily protein [Paenibacillus qinlingensis]NQX57965.1 4'-phosphopantetheinyl transferase superfamily protein [Paenibacillus qinlingensis]
MIGKVKRDRIAKAKHPETALQMLAADLLLRYVLLEKFDLSHTECRIAADEFGKPYLLTQGDIHFNISHSQKWVGCVVDHEPVGIDVESVRSVDLDGIARYFSTVEQEWLYSIEPHKRLNAFYELWTCKESYLKALGKGLSIPLKSFSILLHRNGTVSIIPCKEDNRKRWLRNYSNGSEMKLAVCASQPVFPSNVTQAHTESLVGKMESILAQFGEVE